MGFLKLFILASLPVLKVLLLTALGSVLALDHIDVLGETARKQMNNMVFYVLNPALVGSSLAETITFNNFVHLWFMPVNILITFVIGSLLGWMLVKVTRSPKHLEGLIVGCCAAGNLGNMLLIIIPAICKEKGSPLGDPNVCHKYGTSYASLSMAVGYFFMSALFTADLMHLFVGAVFLWSYVYNIMRICTSKNKKEAYTCQNSSDGESAEGTSALCQDKHSEALPPDKGCMDDAYTLILPGDESEEKVKVTIRGRIERHMRIVSSKVNLKALFAPSTIAAIAGFAVGAVPPIRSFMIDTDAPLRVIQDSASTLGDAAIPIVTLILGANLLRGLRGGGSLCSVTLGIIGVRYILLPLLGILIVGGAVRIGLVQPDPLYQFVLLLQYAVPPAMNMGTMAQLFGAGQSECSVIMLWTYASASIALTLWSTYFLWLVS